MSISIRMQVSGDAALRDAQNRLHQLGAQPAVLWKALGNYGENSTRTRFVLGVGPDGSKWKVSQRVRKSGGQTLVKSTRLLRSITSKYSNAGAAWGSNVAYARIHQLGGKIEKLAFSSTLRLRTNAAGRLLRQKDYSHLAVFARANHKRAVERRYTTGAHTINMPARPYLGVNDEDVREMTQLSLQVVEYAAMGQR